MGLLYTTKILSFKKNYVDCLHNFFKLIDSVGYLTEFFKLIMNYYFMKKFMIHNNFVTNKIYFLV